MSKKKWRSKHHGENKSGFVYLWRDKKSNRYYVGCHWGTPDDGYVCSSTWMRNSYNRRQEDFRRRILETVTTTRADLFIREAYWLSLIKDEELGKRYYNFKREIHSILEYTPEMREKMAAVNRGKKPSAETIAKRSASLKETYNTPVKKAEQAARAKEMWANPKHAEKISDAMKKNWEETREERIASLTEAQNRPEVKEKISRTTKTRWKNPAYRQNYIDKKTGLLLGPHSEERRQANSERVTALWTTEEYQKKMSDSHLNSEIARNQSRINIQKTHTPEAIAKMAQKKRQQHADLNEAGRETHRQKSLDAVRTRWGDPSERIPLDQITLDFSGPELITDSKHLKNYVENIKAVFKPTMTELCEFLGVSRATLNNWMAKTKPNPDKIRIIFALSRAADIMQMKLAA